MDVSELLAITLKKIENKGSQMGHTKKIFKKKKNKKKKMKYLELGKIWNFKLTDKIRLFLIHLSRKFVENPDS